MKIYIAGPMSGLVNNNYPAFHAAAEGLRQAGYEVLNPADVDSQDSVTPMADRTWDWYMRRTVRMLTEADGMALLPGWEKSTGARIERDLAPHFGMPVMLLFGWLKDRASA